jgi:hypothetical protein
MANDVYELKIWYADADGKKSANVTHWESGSVMGGPNPYLVAQELITSFTTSCQGPLVACMANDCMLAVIQARRVNNGGGPTCEVIINAMGSGTQPSVTNAIAANIALIPAVGPYLRKEGHFFLGSIPENAIVGDVWSGGFETLVAAFTAALQAGLTAGADSFVEVIWDRTTSAATHIQNWLFRNVVSPLRRRLKPRF